MRAKFRLLLPALLLAPTAGAGEELRLSSGPAQTVMIELFTSEGCSSCPPAETYLNGYKSGPELWQKYIPLALHVDYWNYYGWRDRFSSAANTRRQEQYERKKNIRLVYTPAFVVNGKEWRRGWFSRSPEGGGATVGTLRVALNGRRVNASFAPAQAVSTPLDLNLAILGMDLTSDIRDGENAGRHARHDFVVLAHKQLNSGSLRWLGELPPVPGELRAPRYALVAWVSRAGDPAPLQATGGFLPSRAIRASR
jgi:hypothetical protein